MKKILLALATLFVGHSAFAQSCPNGYCPGAPPEHRNGISVVTFDGGQKGHLFYGLLVSDDAIRSVVSSTLKAELSNVSVTDVGSLCLIKKSLICHTNVQSIDIQVGANNSMNCKLQTVLDTATLRDCTSKTLGNLNKLQGLKVESLLLTTEFLKSNPGFVETQE